MGRMPAGTRDWLFRLCAAGFLAGAIYHAVGLVRPDWLVFQPAWRHALFVALNLAFAVGFLYRPRWFPWVFAILTAEQLYGHGLRAAEIWGAEGRVDWPSVAVILGLPPMLVLLFLDARKRGRERGGTP